MSNNKKNDSEHEIDDKLIKQLNGAIAENLKTNESKHLVDALAFRNYRRRGIPPVDCPTTSFCPEVWPPVECKVIPGVVKCPPHLIPCDAHVPCPHVPGCLRDVIVCSTDVIPPCFMHGICSTDFICRPDCITW